MLGIDNNQLSSDHHHRENNIFLITSIEDARHHDQEEFYLASSQSCPHRNMKLCQFQQTDPSYFDGHVKIVYVSFFQKKVSAPWPLVDVNPRALLITFLPLYVNNKRKKQLLTES
jgi:hypothetical protein